MSHGHVYVTTKDRLLLAEHFGLTETQFRKHYCGKRHGEYHLKDPEHDCCFLKDKSCSVYDFRPTQCRTWPFWPENMHNGKLKANFASHCQGRVVE